MCLKQKTNEKWKSVIDNTKFSQRLSPKFTKGYVLQKQIINYFFWILNSRYLKIRFSKVLRIRETRDVNNFSINFSYWKKNDYRNLTPLHVYILYFLNILKIFFKYWIWFYFKVPLNTSMYYNVRFFIIKRRIFAKKFYKTL